MQQCLLYNALVVLIQLLKRPWWWTLLLFIPIVNLIMFPVLWVELLNRFGKTSPLKTPYWLLPLQVCICFMLITPSSSLTLQDDELKKTQRTGRVVWLSSICYSCGHHCAHLCHATLCNPYLVAGENPFWWVIFCL